jgi:hypothetical protein
MTNCRGQVYIQPLISTRVHVLNRTRYHRWVYSVEAKFVYPTDTEYSIHDVELVRTLNCARSCVPCNCVAELFFGGRFQRAEYRIGVAWESAWLRMLASVPKNQQQLDVRQ